MTRQALIATRRGPAAEWARVNPIPASGELGYETDTRVFKIGDGATRWLDLEPVVATPSCAAALVGFEASSASSGVTSLDMWHGHLSTVPIGFPMPARMRLVAVSVSWVSSSPPAGSWSFTVRRRRGDGSYIDVATGLILTS